MKMNITVIKRDGREVPYDRSKIRNAIGKAFEEVYGVLSENSENYVGNMIEDIDVITDDVEKDILAVLKDKMPIEDIQDTVEAKLMDKHKEVAKAYITYRYKHKLARDKYNDLMTAVEEKLSAKNVKNQNANVDEKSFGGRIGETASLVMKQYALDYIMSPMARENHLNNEIYIHDLDHYAVGSHNCLSIPFDDLLAKGFNTRQTDVRPAQSVSTAFQLVAVIFQLQSLQQFGGVSATHLDWTMIPYVRKSFYKHFKDGAYYMSTPRFYKWFNTEEYNYLKDAPNEADVSIDKFKEYIAEHCNFEPQDNLELVYDYAMDMTEREIYQAVEGMYHNLKIIRAA